MLTMITSSARACYICDRQHWRPQQAHLPHKVPYAVDDIVEQHDACACEQAHPSCDQEHYQLRLISRIWRLRLGWFPPCYSCQSIAAFIAFDQAGDALLHCMPDDAVKNSASLSCWMDTAHRAVPVWRH